MATQVKAQSRRSIWRTILLVGGILIVLLLLSLAAGILAGSERNRLTMLFIVGPALPFVLIFASRRFDLLVLALPIAALAVPIALPTGTETLLPAALLLAIGLFGIWIPSMVIRNQYKLAPSSLNKPIFIFNTVCCISLVWGIVWRDPVLIDSPKFIVTQLASLITFLVSTGAALLVGNFVQTPARLKYIVIVFIICGSLMTITELFHINQHFLNDRGLWGMWTVIPAYGLLIAQPKLRWYWRVLLLVIIITTLFLTAVINADWISGWAPTIVALLTATFLRSKKAFFVLLVVGALAAYGARDFFTAVADDNINDGSLERLSMWEQNWRIIRAHWLLGTGPAGYAIYYVTYYRDDARSTHNNYMDILAQFGFIGMSIWLWLALAAIYEGWQLTRRAPPGFLRTLAIIATAGWVGAQASMFFGDWVLPFAYNQGVGGYKYTVYTWLFVGTLISIRRLLDTPATTRHQSIVRPL
jgi:O-antigen ligase